MQWLTSSLDYVMKTALLEEFFGHDTLLQKAESEVLELCNTSRMFQSTPYFLRRSFISAPKCLNIWTVSLDSSILQTLHRIRYRFSATSKSVWMWRNHGSFHLVADWEC